MECASLISMALQQSSAKCAPRAKRSSLLISLLLLLGAGYIWIGYVVFFPELPSTDNPCIFYSNQCRGDIKLTLSYAIRQAKQSIFLQIYALTDLDIIHLLQKKAEEGVEVRVFFDPSATSKKELEREAPLIAAFPQKEKGLMHRKILIIDQSLVFLGSANFTLQSLMFHDNLLVGIFHKDLAQFCLSQKNFSFSFLINGQKAELIFLPDKEEKALCLLNTILSSATKRIRIAMFTLTHPAIISTLIKKKEEGVSIRCAVDYYSGRGASKQAIQHLKASHIALFLSQGQQLLHHKWALIDDTTLVIGSANWTQSAFKRNADCLLILQDLSPSQSKYLKKMWKVVKLEANKI